MTEIDLDTPLHSGVKAARAALLPQKQLENLQRRGHVSGVLGDLGGGAVAFEARGAEGKRPLYSTRGVLTLGIARELMLYGRPPREALYAARCFTCTSSGDGRRPGRLYEGAGIETGMALHVTGPEGSFDPTPEIFAFDRDGLRLRNVFSARRHQWRLNQATALIVWLNPIYKRTIAALCRAD